VWVKLVSGLTAHPYCAIKVPNRAKRQKTYEALVNKDQNRFWLVCLQSLKLCQGWHNGTVGCRVAQLLWLTRSLNSIDRARALADDVDVGLMGAYWFRPSEHARGGMPRTMRWPRK